jgi:hypothetical protein
VRLRGRVHERVRVRVYKCRNAGLSGIRSVRYRNKKTNDAGTGPVPKIIDAGMPMPALVSWMPMPSYGYYCVLL